MSIAPIGSQTPIQILENKFARIGAVQEAASVLGWDCSTMMPAGGAAARSEQLSTLDVICHEMLSATEIGDLLAAAGQQNDLSTWQHANLAEMRRAHLHATAVPVDLVGALTKANLDCEMIWRQARPQNDYELVRPALQRVLDLTREKAEAKAAAFGCDPYDALLDAYEPDGKSAEIDRLFAELGAFLPDLIDRAIAAQAARRPALLPEGPFPIPAQKALGEKLMAAIGFDFLHGRLDVSAHPFSGGTPDDVRITTRYQEGDFTAALMGILHETGHAMYERGLPPEWRRQPVGAARGMTLHESQSLLIEMQACRSLEFFEYLAPLARETFQASGPAWEAENLHRLSQHVERGFIRVDADEVTYPAHVILRYQLERELLSGDLLLSELPAAWNERMKKMVGVVPDSDRVGCLQDIHWYSGSFGYFPTYTLGAMTAAQLFDAATRADPTIRPGLAMGNFGPLMDWLRVNIHGKASVASTGAIVEMASGQPLDTAIYRKHLEGRYLR